MIGALLSVATIVAAARLGCAVLGVPVPVLPSLPGASLAALTWPSVITMLGYVALVSLVLYLVPLFVVYWLPEQNLARKYDASWAFVSGASSGLGLAITRKLAHQGFNVLLCALDDDLLRTAHAELQAQFPKQRFVAVGCNLGAQDVQAYMGPIEAAVADINAPVQVVFSNAGYVITRAFAKTERTALLGNFACNVVSHIAVAHFFMARMQRDGVRGCVVFTSSQAAFLPAPANALYGCSKAALTQLATGLAIEGAAYGIDVLAIQAGPMHTRFRANLSAMDIVESIYKLASTPEAVASVLLRSVGRLAVRDHSLMTVAVRLVLRVVDVNIFVWLMATAMPYTPDWKKFPDLH